MTLEIEEITPNVQKKNTDPKKTVCVLFNSKKI